MDRPMSLLNGKDYKAIEILLDIHCAVDSPIILDCTYNTGKMWKGFNKDFKIVSMDIDPVYNTEVVGDFTKMPFEDGSFDVIVFDPPHLPIASASENSSKIWESKYGNTNSGEGREGDNISGMFEPFLKEAKRVLKKDGLVLAKLADIIHNHRYQWQHVDFINAVREIGMTPCDMMVKTSPSSGNLKSSKWINVNHLKRNHSYWIVVRNSKNCEKR